MTTREFSWAQAIWHFWHRWLGRLVLISATANITLGLFLAVSPSLVWKLWIVYVALWIGIFVVAEILKRPIEKELRKKAKKSVLYGASNPHRMNRGETNTFTTVF